jgi:hypothetical protein
MSSGSHIFRGGFIGGVWETFEITMEKNTLFSPIFGDKIYVVPPPPAFKIFVCPVHP